MRSVLVHNTARPGTLMADVPRHGDAVHANGMCQDLLLDPSGAVADRDFASLQRRSIADSLDEVHTSARSIDQLRGNVPGLFSRGDER